MDEVFNLKGVWKVSFSGRVTGDWMERGPADACLDLLRRGLGKISAAGVVVWDREVR